MLVPEQSARLASAGSALEELAAESQVPPGHMLRSHSVIY
jgi:hypothetical protein